MVLHDGAPNVGTAWIQDAYAQSELVLQSLKLAVEFLAPGGHFVTKVFRSKDYNNLLWVFNQLFKKVEATKPPSSRNVSAEIFVVCQDFKAPKRIDPKFLDPRHVFKDLDPTSSSSQVDDGNGNKKQTITMATNAVANVFEPEKKRRKRDGYAEGEMILFKAIGAKEFIEGVDAVGILGTFNEIQFNTPEDKALLHNEGTTEDIKACCSDLKVLGKKDFRNLLKWRKMLREELGLDLSAKAIKEKEEEEKHQQETVEVHEMDEDERIDEELERLRVERDRKARKLRRRKNEERQKRILKMQLSMTTPMDIGMDLVDEELMGEEFFDLQHGGGKKRIMEGEEADESEESNDEASDDTDDEAALDAEERRLAALEEETSGAYEQYRQRLSDRDAKFRAKEARKKNEHKDEWYGFGKEKAEGEDSDGESSEGGYEEYVRRKAQEETFDTDDEEDEQDEKEMRKVMDAEKRKHKSLALQKRKRSQDYKDVEDDSEDEVELVHDLESKQDKVARQSQAAAIWFDNPLFKGVDGLEVAEDEDEGDDENVDEGEEREESEDDDDSAGEEDDLDSGDDESLESTVSDGEEGEQWQYEDEDQDEIKRKQVQEKGLNTAEAITLASQLVNREKTRTDLIDEGFNKHNFIDKSDLPEWFLDDESKHFKVNLPITKEAVDALKAKQRALDARPIKKIAEAKARKKYKAVQRMEKARKKAEDVSENVDISEREKASNIDKLLRRAGMKPKRKEVKVVVAKGSHRALKGRPKGVKGRYRMVDPRQKKELRAMKRKNKAMGVKTTSTGGNKNKRRIPNGY